jgi:hypothetical protein
VRHPKYTTLYIHEHANLLLTAKRLIGGMFLLMKTIIIPQRHKNEEA